MSSLNRFMQTVAVLGLLVLAPMASRAEKVVVVVNSDLAALIQSDLDGYITDMRQEGFDVLQKNWSLTAPGEQTPSDLKAYLAGIPGLGGAVFIGNLPIAWYYLPVDFYGDATYPTDYYYMSLTNVWTDTDSNGIFDSVDNYAQSTATIWVSRIKASSLPLFNETEAGLVRRYLQKIHRFRTGQLRMPDRGLLWADTDWKSTTLNSIGFDVAYNPADCLRVSEAIPGIVTDATNWLSLAGTAYETEYFMCHSAESFHDPGGVVDAPTVAAMDFTRLFWNCWNCSAGRFSSMNYIAGVRIFTPTNGLLAVATTKTGAMLPYGVTFYSDLAQGRTHGEGFRNYFSIYSTSKSSSFRQWNDGNVLLGDGTLRLGRHMDQLHGPITVANDSASTPQDVPCTLYVLANDVEQNGRPLTVTSVSQPVGGTVTCTSQTVTFTPAPGWYGTVVFSYMASNDQGVSRQGGVSVTVIPNYHGPIVQDDAANTTEDIAKVINVLANDSEPDGQPMTIVRAANAQHGTLSVATPNVTYTPSLNWSGVDTFTYWVTEPDGITNSALVTVTVTPANDAPVAVNNSGTTPEDTPITIDVIANDYDADGDTLVVGFATQPATGVVTYSGRTVTFTPKLNYSGTTTFQYSADDPSGGWCFATVTITVTAVNDPPTATPDTATTTVNTAKVISVLANDSDPEGSALSIVSVTQPANGTVTATSSSVTYTPNAQWIGVDTFTYTVRDATGLTSSTTVTVTVNPVNTAPVAVNDSATTAEDTPIVVNVVANDTDANGDVLTVSAVTQPTTGTVTFSGGTVTCAPNANYSGAISFTYTVSDGKGGTATATVSITVTPVNDPPVAVANTATTPRDTATVISVLANDTDPEGDTLSIVSATTPAHGTVVTSATSLTYTPAAGWSGVDTFTYTIRDPGGLTSSASVTVTVTPVNRAPVAANDSASTPEDVAKTISVLANDTDPDGDAITILGAATPANGTVSMTSTTVTYTPKLNWNGTDTFTYTIRDPGGLTSSATVTVTVTPVNDPPVANPDSATTRVSTAVTINVLANDTDVENQSLSIASVGAASNGTAGKRGSSVVYTPKKGWTGTDTFTYVIKDASNATATGTVTVVVNP